MFTGMITAVVRSPNKVLSYCLWIGAWTAYVYFYGGLVIGWTL